MTSNKDIKNIALSKINGKWGKIIGIIMAVFLVNLGITFFENIFSETDFSSFISAGAAVILIPLNFGALFNIIKFYREDDNIKAFEFFTIGFKNFGRAWGIYWFKFLKVLLPSILSIVSYIIAFILSIILYYCSSLNAIVFAIILSLLVFSFICAIVCTVWAAIRGLYYVLAEFIAIENPGLSPKEAVQRSENLMQSHRAQWFTLHLSFIGWFLLGILSIGIGYIWITPYLEISKAAFYDELIKNSDKNTEVIE